MARILAPVHKREKTKWVKILGKMQKMTASPRDEPASETKQALPQHRYKYPIWISVLNPSGLLLGLFSNEAHHAERLSFFAFYRGFSLI